MSALLCIDAPNLDMTLTRVVGHKPTRAERPCFAGLLEWAREHADTDGLEARLFTNVPQQPSAGQRQWISSLLDLGYWVFAKPRHNGSDIDDDMLASIRDLHESGNLHELIVVSHDARNFASYLTSLANDPDHPVRVTVLGFREFAGSLAELDGVTFCDIEHDTDDVFWTSLPRVVLEDLPAYGGWFAPRERASI